MAEFNPRRLTIARMRRALTKVGLAIAVDVTPRSISNYERGTQVPTERTLRRLSDRLDFPLAFWEGADLPLPDAASGNFRAPTAMSARARGRVRAAAGIALYLWRWADEIIRCPEPDVPTLWGADPEQAAQILREDWHLSDKAIPDILRLAEQKGIRVFSLPPDCHQADAFSLWDSNQPFIFVDRRKSAERQRMDVAHEIGHLVLHPNSKGPSKERETEANQFASAFLMPRSSIVREIYGSEDLHILSTTKQVWGVALAALVYRMHTIGLLNEWQFRSHFIQMSRLGYRQNEPNPMALETSSLWKKIYSMLHERDMDISKIAKELSLHEIDVRELTFNLPTPNDKGRTPPGRLEVIPGGLADNL